MAPEFPCAPACCKKQKRLRASRASCFVAASSDCVRPAWPCALSASSPHQPPGRTIARPMAHPSYGCWLSADDDFADLDDRGLVGIVRDVGHDLLGMRAKAGLEGLDRVAEDVTHSDIGGGCAGYATGHALVDRVGLARITHAGLYERHMLVAIVVVVEASPRCIGIHNAYLDHR